MREVLGDEGNHRAGAEPIIPSKFLRGGCGGDIMYFHILASFFSSRVPLLGVIDDCRFIALSI